MRVMLRRGYATQSVLNVCVCPQAKGLRKKWPNVDVGGVSKIRNASIVLYMM